MILNSSPHQTIPLPFEFHFALIQLITQSVYLLSEERMKKKEKGIIRVIIIIINNINGIITISIASRELHSYTL